MNEHNRELVRAVRAYVNGFHEATTSGLFIGGTVGTGKTHLAFGIGRALAERGYWPRYRNFVRVCVDLKQAWSRRESDDEIKDPLLRHSPLILDDLGAERREPSEQGWVSELLYEVIESRYEQTLATIIVSNMNLDDIAERYTDRIASRIAEMCTVCWVEGYDYRVEGPGRP